MKSIAQFKQENPIYQNEPDVKLASFIYDKYYKDRGVDEDDFFKQDSEWLLTPIDTTDNCFEEKARKKYWEKM